MRIPSMKGVFIPAVKFKYQKSKSTRRYKTEMEWIKYDLYKNIMFSLFSYHLNIA